jgi:ABC-type uncharacterized transport system permease subunit
VFASIAVLLPLIFPGRALHLGESVWLPLHWALGIASYGLVAVAVFHAWLVKIAEGHIRHATHVSPGIPLMTLERLTFRFVQASFLLLTATIVVALLFGENLYGKTFQFRWNHKTFFSVLAWLTFGVLLIGRAKFGWRGQTAYRVLYAGSGMLLLAYAGSRFVLEILLKR